MNFKESNKIRFENLTNKELINRINRKFKINLNDDDEVSELFRRKEEQHLNIKVGWNTYELIESKEVLN